jgi:hypothetical protein
MRRQRNQWRPITVAEHEQFSGRLIEAISNIRCVLYGLPGGHKGMQGKLLAAEAKLADVCERLRLELIRDHENGHKLDLYEWYEKTMPDVYVVGEEKPKTLQDLYKRSNN